MPPSVPRRLRARLPVVLGGLGLGLSFPPTSLAFLAWLAFVPLLVHLRSAPTARAAWQEAWLFFLAAFAVALAWPLAHVYPSTAVASLAALLLVSAWMAAPFALLPLLRRRLGGRAALAAWAALYLLMEATLSRGPLAFPWPLLAHTQADAHAFNPLAAWTGTAGLSLWVLLMNVAAYVVAAPRTRRERAGAAAVLVVLLVGAWTVGRAPLRLPVTDVARIALVQPGTAPETWADVGDAARVDDLVALSDSLLATLPAPPDLVAWPETALPVLPDTAEAALLRRLHVWAGAHGTALLTGAIARSPDHDAYLNRAVLLAPGAPRQGYDKVRLVPFAEYVPFVEHAPALRRLAVPAGGVWGYVPGDAPGVMTWDDRRLGVLICLESAFGNRARRYVEQGADVLVTLTHDGWWGRTMGFRQHYALSRLRAVETGRALVQVSVSGISAVALPSGATVRAAGWMAREAFVVHVPIYAGQTPFVRTGDLVTPVALVLALTLLAAAALRARRSARRL